MDLDWCSGDYYSYSAILPGQEEALESKSLTDNNLSTGFVQRALPNFWHAIQMNFNQLT